MALWYKHDIAAWMEGTEGLSDGPYRVYHVVCQLMYLTDGPIHNNERGIAGRCNQHILKFRINLAELIKLGKLRIENGKLHNVRAEQEIGTMLSKRKPTRNPKTTPQQTPDPPPTSPPTSPPMVGDGVRGEGGDGVRGEGSVSKSLKNKKRPSAEALAEESRVEERRGEKQDAAPAAILELPKKQKSPEEQAKTNYYRMFKEELGPDQGPKLATRLLQAKGGDIWQAMSAFGLAREAGDIKTYLGFLIKKAQPYTPIM